MINAMILAGLAPDEAAALWLAHGGPDAIAEAGLFDRWLVSAEEHWQAWERALAIWDSFDLAEPDELEGLHALACAPRAGPANENRRWAVAASAAVIAVVAGVAGYPYLSRPDPVAAPPAMARFGAPDYVTGPGETRQVTLPDGSKLALAGDTSLDIAFADGRRDVRMLKGRATFAVAHDPAHPFAVQAGSQVVTARGTHFEISLAPTSVSVLLTEGSVSVTPTGNGIAREVILTPGQRLVATASGQRTVTGASNATKAAAAAKTIVFHNQPLAEVATTIGGPEKRLVVREARVARLRVSGSFQVGDIDNFVRAIAALHPVRAVPLGDGRLEIVSAR